MFDIGLLELLIIAVVGLIVIGPERLPSVARTVGTWVGRTRRFINQVKTDIDREFKQEELRKALEEEAGLEDLKQIMNTDRFSLEPEDAPEKPDYLVKAVSDEELEQARARHSDTDKSDAADTAPDKAPDEAPDEAPAKPNDEQAK